MLNVVALPLQRRALFDCRGLIRKCALISSDSKSIHTLQRAKDIPNVVRSSQSKCTDRAFTSTRSTNESGASENKLSWLDKTREALLTEALKNVPEYGWTDDALIEGANNIQIPPTMISCVHSGGDNEGGADERLVRHHMELCFKRLESYIRERSNSNFWKEASPAQKIFECIKYRLELNIPLMSQNGRWTEAMVIGAKVPFNAAKTASQIDSLVHMIGQEVTKNNGKGNWSFVERSMVASIYVMTELHLLQTCTVSNTVQPSEESLHDTWSFLNDRIKQLEFLAHQQDIPRSLIFGTSDSAFATAALVSSLGTAVLSLLSPSATALSNVMPNFQASAENPNQHGMHKNKTSTSQSSSVQTPSAFDSSTHKSFNRSNSSLASSLKESTAVESNDILRKPRSNIVHGIDLDSLPPFPLDNQVTERK